MDKSFELDRFKKRAMQQLRKNNEASQSYPINEADLKKIYSCPICNSGAITLLTELYLQRKFSFFSTSVCEDCLFTFRSVSPGFNWFKKCWKTIATDERKVFNPEAENIREKRYLKIFEAVTRHTNPTGKLLDIGAAYGTGTKIFQDGGFEVEAVEPEDNKRLYIEEILGIKVVERSVENLGNEKGVYDAIVMANCLEHVDNPVNALIIVHKMLKPGGLLYLDVPLLWEFVTWSDALFLTHKSYFIEENLTFIFSRIGFKVLEKLSMLHGEGDPNDFGVVLKPIAPKNISYEINNKCNVGDVKRLYRKGLSFNYSTDLVLKYNVQEINHFYQTILLDSQDIIKPSDKLSFIEFNPTKAVA